jgi:hypothetical protein
VKELLEIFDLFLKKLISEAQQLAGREKVNPDKILYQERVFEKFEYSESGYVSAVNTIRYKYVDNWQRTSLRILEVVKKSGSI